MHPVVYKTLQKAASAGWTAFADGWPDIIAFDPISSRILFIVCERSTPGRKPIRSNELLIEAERYGALVHVCVDGDLDVLLTLEQWAELPSLYAVQTVYAQRTKLRNLERTLEQLPKDGPLAPKIRADFQRQINEIRKRLGSDTTPQIGSRVIPAGPELDAHLAKIKEEAGMSSIANEALDEMLEASDSTTGTTSVKDITAFDDLAKFVEGDVALAEVESQKAYDRSKRKKEGGDKS